MVPYKRFGKHGENLLNVVTISMLSILDFNFSKYILNKTGHSQGHHSGGKGRVEGGRGGGYFKSRVIA